MSAPAALVVGELSELASTLVAVPVSAMPALSGLVVARSASPSRLASVVSTPVVVHLAHRETEPHRAQPRQSSVYEAQARMVPAVAAQRVSSQRVRVQDSQAAGPVFRLRLAGSPQARWVEPDPTRSCRRTLRQ